MTKEAWVSTRGIIPARAGTTQTLFHQHLSFWDHPRSRGDYSDGIATLNLCLGSSPLARGLLYPAPQYFRKLGIIPARAGTTQAS